MTVQTLDQPVKVAEFWKSRHRNETIKLEFSTFESRNVLNVRVWFTGSDGVMRPTKNGLSCALRHLPALADAFNKASAKARELNLLDAEAARD